MISLWNLQDCFFACEYHGGYIALRDAKGLYLAPIGSRAALKTRSNTVTKDELFSLEDSLPQASFVAASNTRYVSVKQGKIIEKFMFRNEKSLSGFWLRHIFADLLLGEANLFSQLCMILQIYFLWCVRDADHFLFCSKLRLNEIFLDNSAHSKEMI